MYEFTSRVRYSEIGPDARMKLSALVARMQDCSVFHSLSIGRGPADWAREESGWMIMRWRIVVDTMPICGEPVTTATWAYSFTGVRGGRNFTAKDKDGRMIAKADSLWIYFDRKRQRPMRVPEAESLGYGTEPQLQGFEPAPKRIPHPEGPGTVHEPIAITQAYIDTNHHMNNLAYIDLALGYLPEDFKVHELRIEYLHQVRFGEILIPKTWQTDDSYYIILENEQGEMCAVVQVLPA
jgi:acyl-ACP thioesterase